MSDLNDAFKDWEPQWSIHRKNWKDFVPEKYVKKWKSLSLETKEAVKFMANELFLSAYSSWERSMGDDL